MFNFFKKIVNKIKGEEVREEAKEKKRQSVPKEELEEILIGFDIQYDLIESLLNHLGDLITPKQLEVALLRFVRGESYYDKTRLKTITTKPLVHLIVGVNGAGKTTTIAKLAKLSLKQHKKALLGAGDTFRAAAVKQLQLWGEKLNIQVISAKEGSDPSSLAYNTIESAIAKNIDEVFIDTAGRLHNQTNLKNELSKIARTCSKVLKDAPFYKFLILDGTQGSSGLTQAKIFHETLALDGVIMTKLDGTSKGGAILSVLYELKLPILYLGMGEKEDDLIAFDEERFIEDLVDAVFVEQ
ncbi:signal recognition particle-docking protein FtsY [Helicobacter pylori]|uniref:signal recognition particle-docking protein FtsY n=1 Tax=Helicobacter pylori TaxID=210 RepID=UPI0003AC669B|nr:signal recognition particle-docking protein FtsY [Helicobacter pylori]EPZ98253.1 cell division protein FtsY [Helicobacter pylori UM085]KNE12836.1 cell division protein FtsY [Helicobacter pylori]MBI1561425.1 signal recognition particle-docking protein FtsY [Helicobacter pylori]OKB15311.1 signal recognition particle-docking protein FtsY [Helicobacter pylori]TPH72991.1 signal recognition particle-docking protein FtsY [Helicobacter pylori]